MASLTAEDEFNIEVLKLLLQLAWSDGEVAPEESALILGAARSWGVPEQEIAHLRGYLGKEEPLPAPNMGLLRTRPDQVLEAARALIASDGRLHAGERELLDELRLILGSEG
jgi:tellurite resistance protein